MSEWTQKEAIKFCTVLEDIAPNYGAHVALTPPEAPRLRPRRPERAA